MLYSDKVGELTEYTKYLDREWSSDRLMDAIAAIYAEEPGRELPHYITDRVCCRIERWWLAMWYARLVRDTFNLDDEDWIAHCRATTQPDERHASLTAEERNQGARL